MQFITTRLAKALARPVEIERHSFQIGISTGGASYPSEGGGNAGTVMREADATMYRVKQQRRQRVLPTSQATD